MNGKPFMLLVSLFLVLAMLQFAHAAAGLGISHLDTHALVGVGDIRDVAVAQVQNMGTEPLIIVWKWKQLDGPLTLPVSSKQDNITLEVGMSTELLVVVSSPNEDYIGNYSGQVDITGYYARPVAGSPVVPGGTVNVWVVVKHLLPASFALSNFNVDKLKVTVGDTVRGNVTVKNVGETAGTFSLTFTLDGAVFDSVGVTLQAGQQRTVDFTCKIDGEGKHTLACGDYKVNVEAEPLRGGFTFNLSNVVLMASFGFASTALATVFLIHRRQKHEKK